MSTPPETPPPAQAKPLSKAIAAALWEVAEPFVQLVKAPRALWGINISNFLEGLAYFGVLTILGKYLSEDVGLSDLHAGWVYSVATAGITLSMLFMGGVSDRIGVRRALLISLLLLVAGRFLLGSSGTYFQYGQGVGSPMFWTVAAGLFVIVIGYGMYQPASYAGVKQFTNQKTAAIGYAMLYALMNLGAFVSGVLSPPVRKSTGMVGVYWVFFGFTILALASVWLLLTRRTAARASERVQRENAAFDAAGKAKQDTSDAPAQEAAKPAEASKPAARSLLEPLTLLLGISLLAALIGAVYLYVSAPAVPLQQAYDDSATWLRGLQSPLAALEPGKAAALPADLAQPNAALKAIDSRIAIPNEPEATVDPSAFAVAHSHLQSLAAWLQALPSETELQASLQELDPQAAKAAHDLLRAHAVRVMALAYGLVAPVTNETVDELRLRLKRPPEDPIPLPAGMPAEIIRTAALPAAAMLTELARTLPPTVQALQRTLPGPLGRAITADLQSTIVFCDSLSQAVRPRLGAVGQRMLSEILLTAAQTALTLADRLFDPETRAASVVAHFAADRLSHEIELAGELAGVLPEGAQLPAAQRLQQAFWRYGGPFAVAAVLLLLLLAWRVLRLRPTHPFHDVRFTFFIFVLIPVQTLFAHTWLTLPYYINRAFGGTAVGDNFEFFSNLNPILIFVLTPMVAALTARASVYRMMIWGTLVMAAPTFLLAFPPNSALLVIYIVAVTIGEAMWQPRFLQWVAEIAPKGQTGAYMGIAQFPWFMTKFLTGLYSGYFLEHYCPKVGPQNTEFMWLVYAFIAICSPVALWLARSWMGVGLDRKHV